ncbi:MAG: molybdopterin-dependent oxidoreductase, partial [Vicinamibacterales bacterium]
MPGLGTSFGRGGATTAPPDLRHADAILIVGSSMAEAHPVAFRWVVRAREQGAFTVHVDPRFSRTSAQCDRWAPLRAGTDIVFLGGLVRFALEHDRVFREYVAAYTNAAMLLREDARLPDDLDGVFSGWDEATRTYDTASWQYDRDETGRPRRDPSLE